MYVRDIDAGTQTEIGQYPASAGFGGQVSNDGNIIAYQTDENHGGNGGFYVLDRAAGTTERLFSDVTFAGFVGEPSLTPDGRYLAYTGWRYVYRYDTSTGQRLRLSTIGSSNTTGHASISDNGNFVAYVREWFDGSDRQEIRLRDISSGTTATIATGERSTYSGSVAISGDRRYVAYIADDLREDSSALGVAQAYVHDRTTSSTKLVSVDPTGQPANADVLHVELDQDGSTLALTTAASNLVSGDLNDASDVFVLDLVDEPAATCGGEVVTIAGSGTIVGTSGDDVIMGSQGADMINAGGGNDVVCALGGKDIVFGGPGNDRIMGGADADRVSGGGGADMVFGGSGADRVYGGAGDDVTGGGPGSDRVVGGPGDDVNRGGTGNDICESTSGSDRFESCEVTR